MTFKTILFIVTVLFCLNPLFSQEEKTTQYALKLYHNSLQNSPGKLTPAFSILKPKTSHEFELSQLKIGINNKAEVIDNDGQDFSSYTRNTSNFGIRLKYEYGIKFLAIDEKFDFSLHASAEPYFSYLKTTAEHDNKTLSSNNVVGGRLLLIPRFINPIGERWFVDVNFPVEIMHIYRTRSYYERSGSERSSSQSYAGFFGDLLQFRIGIGLKL